jgi:hypothetical protein
MLIWFRTSHFELQTTFTIFQKNLMLIITNHDYNESISNFDKDCDIITYLHLKVLHLM